jgi:hypothetical protein
VPGSPEDPFRGGIVCRSEVPVEVITADGRKEYEDVKVIIYIPDMKQCIGLPYHQYSTTCNIYGREDDKI